MTNTSDHTLKLMKAYIDGSLSYDSIDKGNEYFNGYVTALKNVKRFIDSIENNNWRPEVK